MNQKTRNKVLILIIFIAIIIFTIAIRTWNSGGLSMGDDSGYAMWTFASIDNEDLLYLEMPNEPVLYANLTVSRPASYLPLKASVMLLGNSTYAIKLPVILFSALSVLLFFLIISRYYDRKFSLMSTAIFSSLPLFVVFYKNSIC